MCVFLTMYRFSLNSFISISSKHIMYIQENTKMTKIRILPCLHGATLPRVAKEQGHYRFVIYFTIYHRKESLADYLI